MDADLDKKLVFPPVIAVTRLRPDMVLWSATTKLAVVGDGVEEAYERKKTKYSELKMQAACQARMAGG